MIFDVKELIEISRETLYGPLRRLRNNFIYS